MKLAADKLQKELNKGDRLVTKSVLGFIAELTNIGVLNHFKFLKLVTDLINQAESTANESADYYLDLAVHALAISLSKLMKIAGLECKNTIANIKEIMDGSQDVVLKQPRGKQGVTRLKYFVDGLSSLTEKEEVEILSLPKAYTEFKQDLKPLTTDESL